MNDMNRISSEEKYKIKADLRKQCLIITMNGFFNEKDAEYAKDTYWECYAKNFKNKPFKILCDAREFKPSSKEAQEILNKMSEDTLKEKIIAWAIISENFLSKNQIKRMVGEINFKLFEDYLEAAEWLDNTPPTAK